MPSTYSDTGNTKNNQQEYSVSEISNALKRTVEDRFAHVRVRGEITGFRGAHSSGHCYFALKDDRARIESVIWRGVASKLKHKPEEGLEVIATGKLSTYPGSSKYQIIIENLEPAGAGALMALLEQRKKKLEAEGLFAPEQKQILPFMPRKIGVITSPTGAVIRDILHRLNDRFPLHVVVWPVRVQGETTGAEVSRAIEGFNALTPREQPDLIIVARGGGSIEDLWGFNDEIVVRAAANSRLPIISAVGHETDWTLIDLAADMRAPTPTGAAELAVPVKLDMEATLANSASRLRTALSRLLERSRSALLAATRGLTSPSNLLSLPNRRLDEATTRLHLGLEMVSRKKAINLERIASRMSLGTLEISLKNHAQRLKNAKIRMLNSHKGHISKAAMQLTDLENRGLRIQSQVEKFRIQRLEAAERMLASLSYKSVLDRGYALIRDEAGTPVARAKGIRPGDAFSVQFNDGSIDALAAKSASKTSSQKGKKSGKEQASGQGDLFQG